MTHCSEIVIYQIKPGQEARFDQVHIHIQNELSDLEGLVEFHTSRHVDQPLTRMDKVTWLNQELALKGFQLFSQLPSARSFMDTVDKVIYSGHFQKP